MNATLSFEVGLSLCMHVSVVVAATVLLQRWLGDARTGCRLWSVCFVSILGLVAAALLLPHRRWFEFPLSLSSDRILQMVQWQTSLVTGLMTLWLLGVALSLTRRAARCLRLLRFLNRNCEALSAEEIAKLPLDLDTNDRHFANDKRRLAELQWMVSDETLGPFCWQLHRPMVVLPRYVIEGDRTTLRHIILHELEHLRTKHPMQLFLQGACSALFWFHPAVWWAANGAELSREYWCDEVVAVAEGQFAAYLRTLVKIAERCGNYPRSNVPQGTLAFGNRKSSLIRRSDRVVQLAARRRTANPSLRAIAIVVLVLVVVAVNQVYLPVNAMASPRSRWSPWPTWTAHALHDFDIAVRDFEPFDRRAQMHELLSP